MSTEVVIREARPSEYEAIGDLTVAAYRGVGEGHRDYVPELRDVAGRAGAVPVLVALDAATDRLLGTATYVPGPGPYHEGEFGDVASMRMLAVAPEAQGRGVGAALAEACLARARDEGRCAVFLHSLPVMARAQRIYERLGFRRAPERDWVFPGFLLMGFVLDLA